MIRSYRDESGRLITCNMTTCAQYTPTTQRNCRVESRRRRRCVLGFVVESVVTTVSIRERNWLSKTRTADDVRFFPGYRRNLSNDSNKRTGSGIHKATSITTFQQSIVKQTIETTLLNADMINGNIFYMCACTTQRVFRPVKVAGRPN